MLFALPGRKRGPGAVELIPARADFPIQFVSPLLRPLNHSLDLFHLPGDCAAFHVERSQRLSQPLKGSLELADLIALGGELGPGLALAGGAEIELGLDRQAGSLGGTPFTRGGVALAAGLCRPSLSLCPLLLGPTPA